MEAVISCLDLARARLFEVEVDRRAVYRTRVAWNDDDEFVQLTVHSLDYLYTFFALLHAIEQRSVPTIWI